MSGVAAIDGIAKDGGVVNGQRKLIIVPDDCTERPGDTEVSGLGRLIPAVTAFEWHRQVRCLRQGYSGQARLEAVLAPLQSIGALSRHADD